MIFATEEVIRSTLKVISATKKVILSTDEVITTILKVIPATTKVILAGEEVIRWKERGTIRFIPELVHNLASALALRAPLARRSDNSHLENYVSHYKSDLEHCKSDHINFKSYLSHYKIDLGH